MDYETKPTTAHLQRHHIAHLAILLQRSDLTAEEREVYTIARANLRAMVFGWEGGALPSE